MTTPLERYQQKRNFGATPEPQGRARARRAGKHAGTALGFVIQKHAASHLHYDFRLELDGTLKSWAVPKGPSLDPKEKRLAMHVEDHPLEYADFEGTIPAGNYGAGTVIVWDRGEWIPKGDPAAGYARGKIEFELRGKKLAGNWLLVKTRGRNEREKDSAWLLIKERDDHARSAAEFNIVEALPDSVLGGSAGRVWGSNRNASAKAEPKVPKVQPSQSKAEKPAKKSRRNIAAAMPKGAVEAPLPLTLAPQLAMLVDTVPRSGDWSYELKFDGYRLLARIADGEVRLFTRNGNDWTSKLKHLAAALTNLEIGNAWLDGEIVMMDSNGRSDFQALQNAFENARTARIQFYIFDLPYLNGFDLRGARLDARRELLERLLSGQQPPVLFSKALDMAGPALLKNACAMKLEGLIGKSRSSHYQSSRSRDWIKLKCLQRQEVVIGGYTDSKRPQAGSLGSLLLGVHEKDGRLRYVGRVGTGFTDTTLRQLLAKLKPLARDASPFDIYNGERPTRTTHWVEPKLVGEVVFGEWTAGGHIRHASFQGLRADKSAGGVTAELPVPASKIASAKSAGRKKPSAKTSVGETDSVVVTHGDRVIDPKTGFTKRQLVDFYKTVAPRLLAHLRERPVSLVRAPGGIDGQLFFQKHLNAVKISHVREIDEAYFPNHPPLLVVDSELALLSCAQMNVIEFHTWNSTLADAARPDRMVFDLDPGEGVSWAQLQDGARLMKAMLDELKLKSFLKTSGGKGLHVVVPLQPQYDWETVKDFSAAIVRHLAKTVPALLVAKSGPRNRVGRIFIDYLRNGLGATTASAFSARARAGLGVSIPVEWDELDNLTGGSHWTVANAFERLDKRFDNVWSGYAKAGQRLGKAMDILGFER